MIRNINNQVLDLPKCPVCDYLTRLDLVELTTTDGALLTATILRCVNTLRGSCTFVAQLAPAQEAEATA